MIDISTRIHILCDIKRNRLDHQNAVVVCELEIGNDETDRSTENR